uniref:Uncharacterized protein n=1 Tax=Chromera velia CCMP2878 TaxID=1169474 RepID=A0A0G4H5A9_9ALVE|eukprot:Cvel_24711.t1-p1 / transcript=Cvel_24711.t1 / gene=Cvel_24711 / organism=Chromera_velia_CCMP2878 / gene_product=hypothetical protein / transcript_product=hypothetical protein / location=Cvel_scaffold2711:11013-14967(-) / protein_length=434 / sequence_SO=supercontig / SO=protein_coding / is_pseudo=false
MRDPGFHVSSSSISFPPTVPTVPELSKQKTMGAVLKIEAVGLSVGRRSLHLHGSPLKSLGACDEEQGEGGIGEGGEHIELQSLSAVLPGRIRYREEGEEDIEKRLDGEMIQHSGGGMEDLHASPSDSDRADPGAEGESDAGVEGYFMSAAVCAPASRAHRSSSFPSPLILLLQSTGPRPSSSSSSRKTEKRPPYFGYDDRDTEEYQWSVEEWMDLRETERRFTWNRYALHANTYVVTSLHKMLKSEVDRLRLLVNSISPPNTNAFGGPGADQEHFLKALMKVLDEDLIGMSVFLLFCDMPGKQRTISCLPFIVFNRRIVIAVSPQRHLSNAGVDLGRELPPGLVSSNFSLKETKKVEVAVKQAIRDKGIKDLDKLVTLSNSFLNSFLDAVDDTKAFVCLSLAAPISLSNGYNRGAHVRMPWGCHVVFVRFAEKS